MDSLGCFDCAHVTQFVLTHFTICVFYALLLSFQLECCTLNWQCCGQTDLFRIDFSIYICPLYSTCNTNAASRLALVFSFGLVLCLFILGSGHNANGAHFSHNLPIDSMQASESNRTHSHASILMSRITYITVAVNQLIR